MIYRKYQSIKIYGPCLNLNKGCVPKLVFCSLEIISWRRLIM